MLQVDKKYIPGLRGLAKLQLRPIFGSLNPFEHCSGRQQNNHPESEIRPKEVLAGALMQDFRILKVFGHVEGDVVEAHQERVYGGEVSRSSRRNFDDVK